MSESEELKIKFNGCFCNTFRQLSKKKDALQKNIELNARKKEARSKNSTKNK